MSSGGFMRRLEALERSISFRQPRCIVVTVPTSTEGVVTAETEAAIGELKREHEVTDADLVVHVSRYRVDKSPSLTVMPA